MSEEEIRAWMIETSRELEEAMGRMDILSVVINTVQYRTLKRVLGEE